MNRIIKFRGLRTDGKGWAYGTYCYRLGRHSIQTNQVKEFGSNPQVTPESVGQYTGLKDKNGVEIYEGDILENKEMPNKFTIEHSITEKGKSYGHGLVGIETISGFYIHPYHDNIKFYEVTGNIHENN